MCFTLSRLRFCYKRNMILQLNDPSSPLAVWPIFVKTTKVAVHETLTWDYVRFHHRLVRHLNTFFPIFVTYEVAKLYNSNHTRCNVWVMLFITFGCFPTAVVFLFPCDCQVSYYDFFIMNFDRFRFQHYKWLQFWFV